MSSDVQASLYQSAFGDNRPIEKSSFEACENSKDLYQLIKQHNLIRAYDI